MDNFDLTKKVKELRTRRGLSQEQLADLTSLSLRTIQRIENGSNVPRGDTLKRLAVALKVSPDEIIDWQVEEDDNVLFLMNFCQLGLLVFPLLGIIIPLAIWITKKDKIKNVDAIGKAILNFQFTWIIALSILFSTTVLMTKTFHLGVGLIYIIIADFYIYAVMIILINAIKIRKGKVVQFKPAFGFLH